MPADWRFRWLVTKTGTWNRLHRVVSGRKTKRDYVGILNGRSLCGIVGDWQMPGIISRMDLTSVRAVLSECRDTAG